MKRKKVVALGYDSSTHSAPHVLAKGQGDVAENMIKKAKENGIPLQEDSSLVEVLSKVEVNDQIPPELYHVVAEILSFIYRIDQKKKEGLS